MPQFEIALGWLIALLFELSIAHCRGLRHQAGAVGWLLQDWDLHLEAMQPGCFCRGGWTFGAGLSTTGLSASDCGQSLNAAAASAERQPPEACRLLLV